MHARRGLEFLAECERLEERLTAAKEAAASEPSQETLAELKAAKNEMRDFRQWARTVGSPPAGTPGRDATIQIGGAVDGMGR
ncbi:hypothetical protein ACIBH1_05440 [Nonomuraea sp. NPDC050663]|uniref:hypothetical protein n=1 Tax=Nonomuraea sp. NPDC050663 TaxID=3364370 RepID=UPI00379ED3A7